MPFLGDWPGPWRTWAVPESVVLRSCRRAAPSGLASAAAPSRAWREPPAAWAPWQRSLGLLAVAATCAVRADQAVFSWDRHGRTAGGVSGWWPSLEALGLVSLWEDKSVRVATTPCGFHHGARSLGPAWPQPGVSGQQDSSSKPEKLCLPPPSLVTLPPGLSAELSAGQGAWHPSSVRASARSSGRPLEALWGRSGPAACAREAQSRQEPVGKGALAAAVLGDCWLCMGQASIPTDPLNRLEPPSRPPSGLGHHNAFQRVPVTIQGYLSTPWALQPAPSFPLYSLLKLICPT